MNKLKRQQLLCEIDEFMEGHIPSETRTGTARNETDILSEMYLQLTYCVSGNETGNAKMAK